MKTVTLQEFSRLAADAANKNELPLTKDGQGYYVSFRQWEDRQLVCQVTYFCTDDSYKGEGPTPESAISNAITKYIAEIQPVQLAAEI